ncbi:fasciclin domain-containing protein [Nocardiopsis sp. NPDC007018]|uniref:fasciclin domain-containing protein n=1 Tax=Nocardiopsis sp. NPDC007018 TaxID=3155721 RepID=UPI0033F93BD9
MRGTTLAVATTAVALALALGACGSGGDTGDGAAREVVRESGEGGAAAGGDTAEPFGPGCSDFPSRGAGSLDAMADQTFTTAIADSPVLGRLAEALERAGLGEDLDTAVGVTVFAPTNEAFDMYPDGEMDDLMRDRDGLAYLLNYHVVADAVGGADLGAGVFDSLSGGQVRTSGSTGEYVVDDYAPVVCADVRTANATVHVVDMLLIPS